jgi:hypothetical protein
MKKSVKITLILFFLSVFFNTAHRAFTSNEMIHPFIYNKEVAISIAWYSKHICELVSFTLVMSCVCFILKPVERHLQEVKWVGHNSILVFVKVWHRIFTLVVIISLLDILHYVISFRQTEWFFLIQNAIFFILTGYYLFKAYKK